MVFYPVLFLFLSSSPVLASDTTLVQSPDGKVQFKLFQQMHQLAYSIGFNGQTVIKPSPVTMAVDGNVVTTNAVLKKVEHFKINETYQWRGVHSTAINQCNGARIIVKNKQEYSIEVRVFNNGAAFRIIIPNSPYSTGGKSESRVPSETTVFNIPSKSTIWYHDLDMHYESVHVKKQIDDVQQGEWVAPPATYKLPQGIYASITEAALVNYPGMALQADGKNGLILRLANEQPTSYPYKLRYSAEDTLRLKQPAVVNGTITTPWRVVMIGKDLNSMVNNDMVWNLNPQPDKKLFPKGMNTDWIKPGRAVWKYLDGGGDGTPEVMKHFTDGAAALGFEHNILEGFWTRWTDEQISELVKYSKQKGVSIWFWKHSKSLRTPGSIDSFFRKCHQLGVAGAKIDFFDSEAKEVVDLYEAILKDAAKYQVMLDFHGANKPTGLERTYPNELTREAVKGMESSKLVDRATHETTIPFTRFLAGPAEYTVVLFGERRKNTTWAHQVASAAILSAPLLTYAANPDTLLINPSVEIIKSIPAVWDETIVLPPSEIGELAVYARRKGNTWFLAVMNGVGARSIKVPLTFLKGNYKALNARDDPADSASILMNEASYSSKDVIELNLVSGGGFITRFSK
ncbi:MAG: glycoside hydrolase family 97 N-terminal domain-containing protein [Ginsengibacter sp.]